MAATLENELGILAVEEAIKQFESTYPTSDWNKLQIEPEGPIIKYEMVGTDEEYKNTLEINALTGSVLKEQQKPLKEKKKEPARRARKALDMTNLMSLTDITHIAKEQVEKSIPYQWELDRQKERTVWKIEFADDLGEQITEVKVDAHDGTITQTKLKS